MSAEDTAIEIGSGNVFADLGLPDAAELQLKSTLVTQLRRLIEARNPSQTAAARMIGIGQADLSKLLRGNLRGYSAQRPMGFLTAFSQDIEIVMRPHAREGEHGRITFNSPTA